MSHQTSVAFIVARLSSSRLPGKQLRTIGGSTLLQLILDALKQCREVDRIVLATVAEESNQPLRDWAAERHLDCFWYEGAIDQVTTRLCKAAEHYNADICVLISADCPLIDPLAVDTLIRNLKAAPKADYTTLPNDAANRSCLLQGVFAARRNSWQRGDDFSDRPELKEHQFPIFGLRPDLFAALPCYLTPDLYGQYHRLSIDTWSDLMFCNRLHDLLKQENKDFTLANVIDLLTRHPHLKAMNQHVHQKRLIENTQRLLVYFSTPPKSIVFSSYKRLSLQIIDRLGWPITFLNADAHADQIKEIGMRVIPADHFHDPDTHNLQACFDLFIIVTEGDLLLSRKLPWPPHATYRAPTPVDHRKQILFSGSTNQIDEDCNLILNRLQQMAAREQV